MKLLKQLSEDVNAYKSHLNSVYKALKKAINEVKEERRLGLAEARDYFTQDRANGGNADTINFEPTQGPATATKQPIAAPQQHAAANPNANKRFHLIFDPSTGKISEMRATKPFEKVPAEFVQPNADQMHAVLKHLESMDPRLADKLVNGTLDIWIPRTAAAPAHASTLAAHTASTGGMNRREMSPEQLAAARNAANNMSLAR